MSDMIRFTCGECGKRLKAPPNLAGRRVKCKCGRSQVVPKSLPPNDGDAVATAGPLGPRPKSRTAVYMLVGVGLLVLAGVGGWLAIGLLNSRSQEVWVGYLKQEDLTARAGDDRLWVTRYSLDGHAVGTLVDLNLPKADRDRVEAELDRASGNVRGTYERVRDGWLIPGSLATRVVPNNGLVGVQAAQLPFSPSAKKITPGTTGVGVATLGPPPYPPPAPLKPAPISDEDPKVVPAPAPLTRSIDDFAGKWRGMVPRSALNRQEDLELIIEFDKKGEGVSNFRITSGDRVFFTGAVSARIRKEGNQYRVVLRRDWAVDLSPDGKVMTWVEKGGDKVTFARQ